MPNRFRSRARGPFGWFITIVGWALFLAKWAADWIGRSTIFDDAALLQTRAGGVIEFLGNQTALWFYLTALALVGLGLFLALPLERLLPMVGRLKKVEGRQFRNREVPLDGFHYDKCRFDAVTFVYNGGKMKLTDNDIGGHQVRTDDPHAEKVIHLLFELGHIQTPLSTDIGALVRDTKTEPPLPMAPRPQTTEPAPVRKGLDFPFRKAVLQVESLKSSRSKTGETFMSAECYMDVRNEAAVDLTECSIHVVRMTSEGGVEELDAPMHKALIKIARKGMQRVIFVHRDLKDVVSRPPHLLKLSTGPRALYDGRTYKIEIELRSEYDYPTLATLQVVVPDDPQGAVTATVENQKPDDRP